MDARCAVLGPTDVNGGRVEMDLLPAKVDQLANPQRMSECHQDQQPIADRIAAIAGRGQQLIDLSLSQVLALPIVGVLGTTTANCRLFRL